MVRTAIAIDELTDEAPARRPSPEHFEPFDFERRVEDWVVCQMDDLDPGSTCVDVLLQNMNADLLSDNVLRKKKSFSTKTGNHSRGEDWSRFHIERLRGIAVVSLSDLILIKEEPLKDLSRDLGELIDAGYLRLIINFGKVERVSSQIVAVLAEARRKCEAKEGGVMKLCVPNQELAHILVMTHTFRAEDVYPDMKAAHEASWPAIEGPRPLPISLLTAMTSPRAEREEPTPASAEVKAKAAAVKKAEAAPVEPAAAEEDVTVFLIPEVGRRRGHFIPILVKRFLIGRDPSCAIRCESPMVSRVHAAIQKRGSEVFFRDLGSTNGSLFNGEPFKDKAIKLKSGDRIQVGPMVFRVAIGIDFLPPRSLEQLVASWLEVNEAGSEGETIEVPVRAEEEESLVSTGKLKVEVKEDVLVVTPRFSDMELDESLTDLRRGLFELFEQPQPKRVVLNLEHVTKISSRGIGVLLAHHLRLDRQGGALRLAEVHPQVRSTIEKVRLPMLLEAFAQVDDAVLSTWP